MLLRLVQTPSTFPRPGLDSPGLHRGLEVRQWQEFGTKLGHVTNQLAPGPFHRRNPAGSRLRTCPDRLERLQREDLSRDLPTPFAHGRRMRRGRTLAVLHGLKTPANLTQQLAQQLLAGCCRLWSSGLRRIVRPGTPLGEEIEVPVVIDPGADSLPHQARQRTVLRDVDIPFVVWAKVALLQVHVSEMIGPLRNLAAPVL